MLPPELLRQVVKVTVQAGQVAARWQQRAQSDAAVLGVRLKPEGPVTEADLEIDRLLRARLGELLPEAGWLSEETADSSARLERELCWVVDPLDGTQSFLQGSDEYGVSVGLVEGERPILGVVCLPAQGAVFWAERGQGAYRGGCSDVTADALQASSGQVLAAPLRDAGCLRLVARHSDLKRSWLAALREQWPELQATSRGSTVVKVLEVATGRAEAFAMASLAPCEWDLCAVDLILCEAGGQCTGSDGQPLRYNRPDPRQGLPLLASRGVNHARLLEAVGRSVTLS